MIVTRTDIIQGAEIQSYLGIVTAEVAYGTNALRDFFAGIRDITGGAPAVTRKCFSKDSEMPSRSWKNGPSAWEQMPSSGWKLTPARLM